MSGEQVVQIVEIVVGGVVSIALAWLAYETRQNTKVTNTLRATIASLHAVMMHSQRLDDTK